MPITIRPANKTDLPVIYNFICELEEFAFAPSLFKEYYLKNIANTDYLYLVAIDENDGVMGYLSCHGQVLLHHNGWVFEIQEMFVQKEARNKGVGKMLMHSLEQQLATRNCKSLEVTANIKRTETHAYYLACGFIETHKKFTKEWR